MFAERIGQRQAEKRAKDMRGNRTVSPHRPVGFADGAALLPGIGFIRLVSPGHV
jgi:hypothetical protein